MTAHKTPSPELAGKFYWPSAEYSTPADNLCWHMPPEPDRDFRCIRTLGHPGKCQHEWAPTIRDYSHRTLPGASQVSRPQGNPTEIVGGNK